MTVANHAGQEHPEHPRTWAVWSSGYDAPSTPSQMMGSGGNDLLHSRHLGSFIGGYEKQHN